MKNVLILPIGSEVGLEINRALRYSKDFKVFGISSDDCNHGKFVCENYISRILPQFNHSDFLDDLAEIILDYNINYIYPASPLLFDIPITKTLDGAKIVIPSSGTVKFCRSKKITYHVLRDYVTVPRVFDYSEFSLLGQHGFPVFIKPNIGQGAVFSGIAWTKDELDAKVKLIKGPLITEYARGQEYTIDCFTDSQNKLRFVGARERVRIKNGISVNSVICQGDWGYTECIRKMAATISDVLEMRGGWFFQVKLQGDEPVLLEVEPRISGTSGIWRQVGVNLPLLTLYDLEGVDVEIQQLDSNVELDRAYKSRFKTSVEYEHVYIDLDDTLIVDDKINTDLVKFIYQCKNKGIELYLLSKSDSLEFSDLFDMAVDLFGVNNQHLLTPEEHKYNYINHFPAIFIDDSFGERKEVKDKLNIPVFDVDAVESLIE
jgi:predicted ATP-grasp superfamily ATP-dependent carboligase